MTRQLYMTLVLALAGVFAAFDLAAEDSKESVGRDRADLPFVLETGDKPTETELLAFAKGFCVAMRRQHAQADAPSLRRYFDPHYLEKHGLLDGDFRVEMAAVGAIYNIQLADDNRTLLCYVQTGEGQKEAILLRTITRDGKLYLSPTKPPAEQTNVVTPWLLRMKL